MQQYCKEKCKINAFKFGYLKIFAVYLLYNHKQMKVPAKLQKLIEQLRTHGDIKEIQQRNPEFSRFSISQVLAGDGDSRPEVVAAVADYYEERKDIISDYIIEE